MAQIPGTGLFDSEIVKQLLVWQVLGQILSPILAPMMAEIQADIFSRDGSQTVPLAVSDAVEAALKNHWDPAQALAEVKKWGLDEERFNVLLSAAGDPPGVEQLLELLRRKVIPADGPPDGVSYAQGVREGRTMNKWAEPLKALAVHLPSPADALRAALEGQIDKAGAKVLYEEWGGAPEFFDLMFDTEGSAPTPLEAAEMARRGIIPWEGDEGPNGTSFLQAFLEGPWRNKWESAYKALSVYVPPPRTITALLRENAITDAQGLKYLEDAGLTPELAQAYIDAAHKPKAETAKELTKGEIVALYSDGGLTKEQAVADLAKIQIPADVAGEILALADLRQSHKVQASAVSRVRSLYLGHKITEQETLEALADLGLPLDQRTDLIKVWSLEAGVHVAHVTAAEIATGVKYEILTGPQGMTYLEGLGYSEFEAYLLLATHLKGQVPGVTAPPVPATLT